MVMEKSLESMQVIKAMADYGNPNSVSDAGVGALCARAAVMGAFLNVKINCADLGDKVFVENMLSKGSEIENKANALEQEILQATNDKINK
jgi:glutamate formiminotransferase/formiminotetrahydrofolate cyclodeaminase